MKIASEMNRMNTLEIIASKGQLGAPASDLPANVRTLEKHGLVSKEVVLRRRVVYTITKKGKDVLANFVSKLPYNNQ